MRGVALCPDRCCEALHSPRTVVRDAIMVCLGCALVGLLVNAIRNDGIPLVQQSEYEILVPCPETGGATNPVRPTDSSVSNGSTLLLDARSREAFDRWHMKDATHVPFDYLEPTSPETIRKIAASRSQRVVVYGDGSDPDSGEQLAKEISGKGIRNVGFVVGGAPALERERVQGGGAP